MLTQKPEIISEIQTDIFSYEVKSNLHILIFPGNPGIASFYLEMANRLIQNFEGNVNLYIISYAGFTQTKPQKTYSLQEELNHKVQVVNHLKTKAKWSKKSQVVFVGHSIGAWLTKELVKIFQKELKPTSFLLFPFLAKSGDEAQVNYAKLLENKKYIKLLLGVYRVVKKIPIAMIESITKLLYTHASDHARKTILDYFVMEKHIPESIIHLATTEFQTLTSDMDLDFFKEHHASTILFYCADDIWAPISQLEFLKTKIPNLKSEIIPLITHDFCVNTEQSKTVADKILRFLRK